MLDKSIDTLRMEMLDKLRLTLTNELPIVIEEKITSYSNGKKTIFYETITEPIGSSYYWLVKFTNGQRIPYPLLNLEGAETSPFQNGEIVKSEEEKAFITKQEKLVREAFKSRTELKQHFDELQISIFGEHVEEEYKSGEIMLDYLF